MLHPACRGLPRPIRTPACLPACRRGSACLPRSYRAELVEGSTKSPVILKKATEFGEAETWMNERMMRASPGVRAAWQHGSTACLPRPCRHAISAAGRAGG